MTKPPNAHSPRIDVIRDYFTATGRVKRFTEVEPIEDRALLITEGAVGSPGSIASTLLLLDSPEQCVEARAGLTRRCLKHGMAPEPPPDPRPRTRKLLTDLLFSSLEQSRVRSVEFAVGLGADVNAKNVHGWSPLQYAAYRAEPDLVRALLKLGADINAKGLEGGTALGSAVCHSAEAMRILVEARADLYAVDNDGDTPLHLAIERGQPAAVIDYLVAQGAPIEASNRRGRTPLHEALAATPPFFVAEHVATLLHLRANPNAVDQNGNTPLHLAVWPSLGDRFNPPFTRPVAEMVPLVKQLLAAGARTDATNKKRKTPGDLAPHEVVRELLSVGQVT